MKAKNNHQKGDNPYVDQFVHGRGAGPIEMEVLKA